MNDKDLSKPVCTVDVQRGRPDGNMFAVAWSSAGHALPDGPHFLYSPEYVQSLLGRIAELRAQKEDWYQESLRLQDVNDKNRARIAELELDAARYATLRDEDAWGRDNEPGLVEYGELGELSGDKFDAAIDARIAKNKELDND